MPLPRNLYFDGITVNNAETFSLLENISYEATESSLHDIVDRLEYIAGPRSQEVKDRLEEAHRAIEALEAVMLAVTTFQRQPQRHAVPAEPNYDPHGLIPQAIGIANQINNANQEIQAGIPARQRLQAGDWQEVGEDNTIVRLVYEEPVVQVVQDVEAELANILREEIAAELRAERSND